MRNILSILSVLILLTACGDEETNSNREAGTMSVSNAYSFEVPEGFPAAAVFMTINNDTDVNDRMVAFNTNYASRTELHTMVMQRDIMRMRRVDNYTIASGEEHVLEPGADHLMIFGVNNPLRAGTSFEGTAVFETAGEVPVTVNIRPRSEMNMESE